MNATPFAHQGSSTHQIMLRVCVALVPTTGYGFYLFGWPAVHLFWVTVLSALVFEAACLALAGKPVRRVYDGSAALTGWLIALSLPPWAPWWIGVTGSFMAIVLGKQLYGGLGQNIFNPAMLARTGLLIAFPAQMTQWILPSALASGAAPDFWQGLAVTFSGLQELDGYTAATPLGEVKTGLSMGVGADETLAGFHWSDALLGISAGSMGETSALLIALGGVWLIWQRIIRWEIPLAMIGTLAGLTAFSHWLNPEQFGGAIFHVLSGGVLLAAFFIATDPVTAPFSHSGRIVFGAGCAAVIFIIRVFGTFPEAVGFAVLFMNAFTPLIDRALRPRVYGRLSSGKPLPKPSTIQVLQEVTKR